MNCPRCTDAPLLPHRLEASLPCHRCRDCGGIWVLLGAYLNWLSRKGNGVRPDDPPARIELGETSRALLCPSTRHIMLRFRICEEEPHWVDQSPAINGVWLDQGEWELLKQKGLAGRLHEIFTEPWQARVREVEARRSTETRYRSRFGEVPYARLSEFRRWLLGQKDRRLMLHFLGSDEPPP